MVSSSARMTRMRTKADHLAAIRLRRRSALVVNTRSRRGLRYYQAVWDRLQAAGFDLRGVFPVSEPGALEGALDAALELRPDLLMVGGGDGTLSLAARRLACQDIALGLLPLGTTNNFARSLGIPLDLDLAVRVLTHGKVADVDLGQINGMFFANLVSVGVSGQVAGAVPHRLKGLLGRAAYPLTALARLPGHAPFQAIVTSEAGIRSMTTHQLNIANGSFHAGRPIAADASPDDRLLLAYRLGDGRRSSLIGATIHHALLGGRRSYAEPAFFSAREFHLYTDPPLPLDVDGELHGCTPARITLVPNALRVMVAPEFRDT